MKEFKPLRLRKIDTTDIKGEYQKRADELTMEEFGEDVEFYDLTEEQQDRIYKKAMELVDDDLADLGDSMLEDKRMRDLEDGKVVKTVSILPRLKTGKEKGME